MPHTFSEGHMSSHYIPHSFSEKHTHVYYNPHCLSSHLPVYCTLWDARDTALRYLPPVFWPRCPWPNWLAVMADKWKGLRRGSAESSLADEWCVPLTCMTFNLSDSLNSRVNVLPRVSGSALRLVRPFDPVQLSLHAMRFGMITIAFSTPRPLTDERSRNFEVRERRSWRMNENETSRYPIS